MKTFAILIGFLVFVSAVTKESFKLPEDRKAKLEKAGAECTAELNADPALLAKIGDGTLPRTEAADKFAHCFGVKTALIDDQGHVHVDKVIALLGNHPLASAFEEAFKKCNAITKDNPVTTLAEIYQCYVDTTPLRISF